MLSRVAMVLVGLSWISAPLAAQTVILSKNPSAEDTNAHDKSARESARQALLANKLDGINDLGPNGFDILAFDSRVHSVRGTPFLVSSWSQGDVTFGNAPKPTPGIFKFDVYTQQLRAYRAKGDSIILAPEKVQAFTLRPTGPDGKVTERHFERLPSGLWPELPITYAEDISVGNELRLLEFRRKTILKGHADPAYGNGQAVDSFQSAEQYYLRWSDGTFTPVKPTKASILAAVAQRHASAVSAEMQDKTKAKTDADLAALVQRIDGALAVK